ncbi:MAG: CHAP domain-containing protein [Janthinobacterium lividum]
MVLTAFGAAAPVAAGPWQCVTFARAFSGVQLFGDAATWWGQAVGKYDEGAAPRVGAVLVFKPSGHIRVGHVATVTQIVSDHEIRVTHANWSPIRGSRGQVEVDVTVTDTSDAGDWSRVKVWYAPSQDLGRTDYPVYGFIYGGQAPAPTTAIAAAQVAAMPIELAGL